MGARWTGGPELPPGSNRDDGGTAATGAADPRPGGQPGRAICEALILAVLTIALITFVVVIATVIHT